MKFTYKSDLSRPLDRVRFAIGDNVEASALVSDDEINAVLALQPTVTYAAASVADYLAAKFASNATFKNLSLSVNASDRYKHYKDLARTLRSGGAGELPGGAGAGIVLAEGFTGGASRSRNSDVRDDESEVQPTFSRGMDDSPGTSGTDVDP